MKEDVQKILRRVLVDDDFLDAMLTSPPQALQQYDLSDEERSILESRDRDLVELMRIGGEGNQFTLLFLDIAGDLGLRVKVLPGISSFDAMIVDLRLDPGSQGVQMFETTALLLQRRPLQPDVPCFLWQIGSVETRMFTRLRSVPERFTRLQEHLLKSYPADHRVEGRLQLLPPAGGAGDPGAFHRPAA